MFSLNLLDSFRKKKKKDKEKMAKVAKHIEESASPEEPKQIRVDKRTAAEIAFDKAKEKRVRYHVIDRVVNNFSSMR